MFELKKFVPFNKLGAFYCNRILPQAYDDSLSFQELLYRMFRRINEVIDYVNSFEDLLKEIEKDLEDMDSYIKTTLTDFLQEMYENGELKQIVEEVTADAYADFQTKLDAAVAQMKADNDAFKEQVEQDIEDIQKSDKTMQTLEMRRVWRECYRVGTNDRLNWKGLRPHGLQSGTKFTWMGINYIAVCIYGGTAAAISNNEGTQTVYGGNDDDVLLKIFNQRDYSLAGQIRFRGGHADCMDFNEKDGYFYIGPKLYYPRTSTSDILRIHVSNVLSHNTDIVDPINLPTSAETIEYVEKMQLSIPDEEDLPFAVGEGIGSVTCGTCEANEIIAGKYSKLYKYDWGVSTPKEEVTTNALVRKVEAVRLSNNGYVRTASYANVSATTKHIYMAFTEPNMIIRVDRESQEITWIYNLPFVLNAEKCNTGELEGLKVFENGDIYIFTHSNMIHGGGGISTVGAVTNIEQLNMGQCFYQNLKNNIAIPCDLDTYRNNVMYVHVDSSSPNPNPTGYGDSPFNNIIEALDFAQSQRRYNTLIIYLHNESNPYYCYICTDKNIIIRGTGLSHTPTIGGLYVWGGNVTCINCTFWYSLQYPLKTHPAYVCAHDAILKLQGCLYENNAEGIGLKTANYFSNSVVSMGARLGEGVLPPSGIATYSNQSEWETSEGWDFIDPYNSIVSTVGKHTAGGYIIN